MSDADGKLPLPNLENNGDDVGADAGDSAADSEAAPAAPPISKRCSTCR